MEKPYDSRQEHDVGQGGRGGSGEKCHTVFADEGGEGVELLNECDQVIGKAVGRAS